MKNTEKTNIQRSLDAYPLREPVLAGAIRALRLPSGSRGLDAGCGIGLQAEALAGTVGPVGHITGVDISPECIRYGEDAAGKSGLSGQIKFIKGDVNKLPFDDDAFDWAWSVDCVGYPVGPVLPQLKELARVVKPGGIVAILAWSCQQFLPGYPLEEARLNAFCSAYSPFVKGKSAELNFVRSLRWFEEAGLVEPEASTHIGSVQSPLSPDIRRACISLFEMLWGSRQPETTPEVWAIYQRLCNPESPDFILDLPEYYGFFTYSMFRAVVSGKQEGA